MIMLMIITIYYCYETQKEIFIIILTYSHLVLSISTWNNTLSDWLQLLQ